MERFSIESYSQINELSVNKCVKPVAPVLFTCLGLDVEMMYMYQVICH